MSKYTIAEEGGVVTYITINRGKLESYISNGWKVEFTHEGHYNRICISKREHRRLI